MQKTNTARRLFIFASYDKNSIIDDYVVYYVRALTQIGDVIFYMDNDTTDTELNRIREISPNILFVGANRHNEYDFGSYKRGYIYANENNILKNYDWIYFVNDSVFGPFKPLEPILSELESRGTGAIGMFQYADKNNPTHLQSWFVGIRGDIAKSDYINKFMLNIEHMKRVDDVISRYELGLSKLLKSNGCEISALQSSDKCNEPYLKPIKTLENGIPFLKRKQNALAMVQKIDALYKFIPSDLIKIIRKYTITNKLCFNRYESVFSLRLFALPIIKISKSNYLRYFRKFKIILFGWIPILSIKISINDK